MEVFHQFPSTFCTAERPSVNFPKLSGISRNFRQLPSTFRVARRHSVNFCQLSVRPGDFPLISVNFPCGHKSFREVSVCPNDLPSTSVNFLCILYTFRHLQSIFMKFCAAGRPYIHFRLPPMPTGDLLATSGNSPCGLETFPQIP